MHTEYPIIIPLLLFFFQHLTTEYELCEVYFLEYTKYYLWFKNIFLQIFQVFKSISCLSNVNLSLYVLVQSYHLFYFILLTIFFFLLRFCFCLCLLCVSSGLGANILKLHRLPHNCSLPLCLLSNFAFNQYKKIHSVPFYAFCVLFLFLFVE